MPAAPITRFLEALNRSPVLDAVQREQLADLQQRCAESRTLAHEILRRGWLTAYQVNLIAQDRGTELTLGPYILLERIGVGGMGQVFKARQRSLQRIVALKVIRREFLVNPQVVRRFLREIRAASQLTHPNLVHAYDADQIDGAYYIAMEYVEGIDLARLVKKSGPLPVWQACELVRQTALGLQHAFEHGLIHRDIKPANLLVQSVVRDPSVNDGKSAMLRSLTADHGPRTTDFIVKITDFGLARWADDDPDRPTSHLTQVGTVLGTPDFIAPEQARCSSSCDIRADLYSLGATFYYLLAGQAPFPTGTLTDKLMAHQLDHPEPVGKVRAMRLAAGLGDQPVTHAHEVQFQVPGAVEEIVTKLLAKHPAERYQTPAELAAALAAIQERLARGTLPVPPRPQPETLVEFELAPLPAVAPQPVRAAVPVAKAPVRASAPIITLPVMHHRATPRPGRMWPWLVGLGTGLGILFGLAILAAVLAARWSGAS